MTAAHSSKYPAKFVHIADDGSNTIGRSCLSARRPKVKTSQEHRHQRLKCFAESVYMVHCPHGGRKLLKAAGEGDLETVSRCLDSGADPCICDEKKRTALHFAAAKGCEQMVQLLLARGADPNAQDLLGNTALHLAACTNRVKIITHLLKAGTDVRMLDRNGKSPIAVASGRLRLLLAASADTDGAADKCAQLKAEVQEVVDMMRAYLERSSRAGRSSSSSLKADTDAAVPWGDACERMQRSATVREVNDAVTELLESFNGITLTASAGESFASSNETHICHVTVLPGVRAVHCCNCGW